MHEPAAQLEGGPSGSSSHRSALSIDTYASGFAEAIAAEFPAPPTEIPTTPVVGTPTRSTIRVPTPTGSHYSASTPTRTNFSTPTPTRAQFAFASNTSAATPPGTPRRDRFAESRTRIQPTVGPVPRNPLVLGAGRDVSTAPGSSPFAENQAERNPDTESPRSIVSALAFDKALPADPWQGGESGEATNTSADNLVEGLLISTLPSAENDRPHIPLSRRDSAKSGTSAITYPPFAPPFHQSPPAPLPSPLPPIASASAFKSTPTALSALNPNLDVEPVQRPPSISKRPSEDSDTVYSHTDQQTSILRAVSMTGNSARAPVVVGYAPATLRHVPKGTSTVASVPLSAMSAVNGHPLSSAFRSDDYLDDSEGKKGQGSILTSPAGRDHILYDNRSRRNGASNQSIRTTRSARSFVSSFFSRISHIHPSRLANWLPHDGRVLPNSPGSPGDSYLKRQTEIPIPDVHAGISPRLSRSYHRRHQSVDTSMAETSRSDGPLQHRHFDRPGRKSFPESHASADPGHESSPAVRKRKVFLALGIVSFTTLLGLVVGLTLGLRRDSHTCPGNLTGADCDLDATCVCTSSANGPCVQLAQSLVSLTPSLNTLFQSNYTPDSLATAIWRTQGAPLRKNCASQANLVDVAPALNPNIQPNRTTWAQTALLWNLVKSQDLDAVAKMRSFVVNAPWHTLPPDALVQDAAPFQITVSGYIFDFAARTVTQPSVSFAADGQPIPTQLAKVGYLQRDVLDRMYSYALASSTQQQTAMSLYWRTVLQQNPEDMAMFISAVSVAPILIPFDATASPAGNPVAAMLTNSTDAPFPPPLACYPGLNPAQIGRLNATEISVFELPPVIAATSFNASCFPTRPQYGLLDITRLRLPFLDSATGLPKQAVILQHEVAPRAVLYSGLGLASLPSTNAPPLPSFVDTDPRQFGTLNHMNHVMLSYLSSIPDVNVAIALVEFILSSSLVPPANSTLLFSSLSSIPPLEVAVFGSIDPSDISSSFSSFSSPSGSLFFGSDQSASLRQWSINAVQGPVVWTEFAVSPLVVRDDSFTDEAFNSVWNPAFAFHHLNQSGVVVDVSNITAAFQATGQFVP